MANGLTDAQIETLNGLTSRTRQEGIGDLIGAQLPTVAEKAAQVQLFTETIGHADLTAAATAENIALSGFPANSIIVGACLELDTDFSGGSVSAITAEIGDAGDTNELAAAVDVFTGAGAGIKDGEPTAVTGFGFHAAYSLESMASRSPIDFHNETHIAR